jgi:hypothetical protein
MSTTATATSPTVTTSATLRELALVNAKKFARHPLFVFGVVANFALIYASARDRVPSPLGIAISPAFFVGIFGLVVAYRLTTSLRRTHELVDSMPSSPRRRTAALCLSCGVPFLAGIASAIAIIVLVEAYPPERSDPGAQMTWFGDYPATDVVATLLAIGTISALGGPLLGVLIGTWAPFRGSALLAIVGIFFLCEAATHWPMPWRVALPWSALADDRVIDGAVVSSTFVPGVSEAWFAVYALLMCGLAAVGAMLRDPVGRRPLLWTGAALAVAAAGAWTLTVT